MMKVNDLILKFDFHDSNVIELTYADGTVVLRIDLCMWRQAGYKETEDEIKEVSLHFKPVADYRWDSKKSEKDIDYDTILEMSYSDGIVRIVLEDDDISLLHFKCDDVSVD